MAGYINTSQQCFAISTMNLLHKFVPYLFSFTEAKGDINYWIHLANKVCQKNQFLPIVIGQQYCAIDFIIAILRTNEARKAAFEVHQELFHHCACGFTSFAKTVDNFYSFRTPDDTYRGMQLLRCEKCDHYVASHLLTTKISEYLIVVPPASGKYNDSFNMEMADGSVGTWHSVGWVYRFGGKAGHCVAYYLENNRIYENNDGRVRQVAALPDTYLDYALFKRMH